MRWLIVLAGVFAFAGVNYYIGLVIPSDWHPVFSEVWCPLSGLVIGAVGANWALNSRDWG